MADELSPMEEDFLGGDNFPPEYVSPAVKEKPEYGLQYVRAINSSSSTRMGPRFYFDDADYQALIEIAQGRQSVDNIRRLFNFFDDPLTGDDGSANLAYIDPQVLNLAPKYTNRAVAKMQKYSYDIAVDAVDPISLDEKTTYAANIRAFYRLKDFVEGIGVNIRELFPDLDIDALPSNEDELLYDLSVNPKIKKEIAAELAIKLLHYVNDYKQKMREADWWTVVIGKSHLHFYNDENGVPRVEPINPKYHVSSYVDNESYAGQEYSGFYDFITINQLRKEMLSDPNQKWTEQDVKEICDRWRSGNRGISPDTNANWDHIDGLDYIPVFRFYFKSEDNRRHVSMKNKYGSDMLLEKSFNYEPGPDVKKHFESGERRVIENTYTSVYGGTWIVDSDIVFNYGRKKYPRLNLVEAQLPIVSFAPNMKEGRVVSFTSQMIEPLMMINVAWNKIKEIIAKGWMGVREIDFTQLEEVALGAGGQKWSPRRVYTHFLQTNTLIKRSKVNRHDQQYAGSAVEDRQTGLLLADYFSTFTTAINILEQMTSTAVTDSISVPDRLSATAAKQSAMTSDIDMEYLYNSHEIMYLKGSHMMLLLLQESLRDKNKVGGFVPALGKANTNYFEAPETLAYCELGLTMSKQPTQEEWINFYMDVQIALKNKEISLFDSIFLREIDNLKQARQIMGIRAKQHIRTLREEAEFNNNLAIKSNVAAAEAKAQYETKRDQSKGAMDMEVAALNGRIQLFLKESEGQIELEKQGLTNQSKERITRQTGLDTIIKETIRSSSDRYDSNNKLRGTIVNATQKAESDRKKLEAPKPKAKTKK